MQIDEIKDLFYNNFGSSCRIFSAPGRINIIGEHTDYNNGFVLPAAIDKRVYLAIAATDDWVITINSVDYNETVSFNLFASAVALPHWAIYPYGVVQEIKELGCLLGGFNAVVCGEIPTGAGLSSSAALESVFAFALNTLFKLNLSTLTLAKIGQRAEHNFAKVKCGIMDQFASLHGKSGQVVKLDCRSLDYEYFPLELGDYEFILVDTGVKHSLASSEYNLRRQQCDEGVKALQQINTAIMSLRDITLKDLTTIKGTVSEKVYQCCEYVAEENSRVLDTCNALTNNQIEKVGELMYQSHAGLRDKYKVSCEELDLLVDTALSINGVIGSRMMGGGFGGCTLNLVKKMRAGEFKAKIEIAYIQKYGKKPAFYEVTIDKGADEIE
ncbi:MAG: galactokinase [Bacteroidales bacterium]|nr:MAG: galactokinase [Bacteroidales bacterium]